MRIRFWGTRGSLAKPGRSTLRYGGNTSCVEVRTSDETLVVLDCGTGIHDLGEALLASGERPLRGHLLITHTHWDHIQGLPFFGPLFVPDSEWDVYAPGGPGQRLEDVLAGQMDYTYFPVRLEQLAATIRYHNLVEGSFQIGDLWVTTHFLSHPGLNLGYRLEGGGVSLVYATDHEPHARSQPEPATWSNVLAHREDQRHVEFLAGADLVIHDAQYTAEEYPQKVGWGHTPVEWATDYAVAAGARMLALYHHDSPRDDESLDQVVETCQRRAAAAGSSLEIFAAAEGQVVELTAQAGSAAPEHTRRPEAMTMPVDLPIGALSVLIADEDEAVVQLLSAVLRLERLRPLAARDGASALELARAERPNLILLDWDLPGVDGIEVVRALRADSDPRLRDVPVVVMTAENGPERTAAGFAGGATDYLMKPFTPAHVRTRVRTWLLRAGAVEQAAEQPS